MATVYYSNLQYTVDISRPKWVNDHRMMGLIPLRAASKITCHSGHQWTWSFNDSNSLQGRRAGMSSCSNWSFPICECEMPVLGSHHGLCLHSLCHIYIYIHISMYIYIHTLALISIRSVRCSAKCHELFGSVLSHWGYCWATVPSKGSGTARFELHSPVWIVTLPQRTT